MAAKLLKGMRISHPGLPGPDVRDVYGELHEIKYRAKLPHIYQWWAQACGEGAAFLTVKAAHKPFLVIMSVEKYHAIKNETPDRWTP